MSTDFDPPIKITLGNNPGVVKFKNSQEVIIGFKRSMGFGRIYGTRPHKINGLPAYGTVKKLRSFRTTSMTLQSGIMRAGLGRTGNLSYPAGGCPPIRVANGYILKARAADL